MRIGLWDAEAGTLIMEEVSDGLPPPESVWAHGKFYRRGSEELLGKMNEHLSGQIDIQCEEVK